MKKILTALVGVILLLGVGVARANQVTGDDSLNGAYPPPGAVAGKTDISTLKMKPGYGTSVSTDVALGVNAKGVLYNTYGIVNQVDWFNAPVAASTGMVIGNGAGVDFTTITVNIGNLIVSSITAGGTTYVTVDISSQPPQCPRNVTVFISSSICATCAGAASAIGVLSTTTIQGRLQLFGIDNLGNPQSETILFSTANPVISTGVVASLTNFTTNYGQGVVAWSSISSFTITITSITAAFTLTTQSFNIKIGYGNRLGLSNDVRQFGDVYKIVETVGASDTVVQVGRLDSDYNTYTPVLAPNGTRSYQIWYRVKNSPRK